MIEEVPGIETAPGWYYGRGFYYQNISEILGTRAFSNMGLLNAEVIFFVVTNAYPRSPTYQTGDFLLLRSNPDGRGRECYDSLQNNDGFLFAHQKDVIAKLTGDLSVRLHDYYLTEFGDTA